MSDNSSVSMVGDDSGVVASSSGGFMKSGNTVNGDFYQTDDLEALSMLSSGTTSYVSSTSILASNV